MEKLRSFTRKEFERLKASYESVGYKVPTKWRKGLKSIRLGDIVLGYRNHPPRS